MIRAALQNEAVVPNEKVQITTGRADRTIAVEHGRRSVSLCREAHRLAMAPARNRDQRSVSHSTVTDFARLRG